MCEKSCLKEKTQEGVIMQINGIICIICIKGSFYETPLYDQVRSDKQDGDKG